MGFLVFDVGLLRQHPVRVRFGSVLPVKPANFETIAALPNLSSEKEKTLSNEKTVWFVEVCFFAVDCHCWPSNPVESRPLGSLCFAVFRSARTLRRWRRRRGRCLRSRHQACR
jgi:hypothetical protein